AHPGPDLWVPVPLLALARYPFLDHQQRGLLACRQCADRLAAARARRGRQGRGRPGPGRFSLWRVGRAGAPHSVLTPALVAFCRARAGRAAHTPSGPPRWRAGGGVLPLGGRRAPAPATKNKRESRNQARRVAVGCAPRPSFQAQGVPCVSHGRSRRAPTMLGRMHGAAPSGQHYVLGPSLPGLPRAGLGGAAAGDEGVASVNEYNAWCPSACFSKSTCWARKMVV
ncbi:unnamed protein product, partial [Amoebophrya sp. A120]